jgi:CheY-like chemotaxis protein
MPLEILVVEDNPGDALLIKEVTSGSTVALKISIASSGEEAIAKLADPEFKPNLIILDLNIPKYSGMSLLERFKESTVPVVIFSSSSSVA